MKQDLDTMTNMILNNEYKLHEDEPKQSKNIDNVELPKALLKDKLYTENNESLNDDTNTKRREEQIEENLNVKQEKKRSKIYKKKTLKQKFFIFLRIILIFVILIAIFIFLFFKTKLFEKYKEIWVVTAMSTMNHQYLATWFLSDDEIQAILDKNQVQNNEDSDSNAIHIGSVNNGNTSKNGITIEKIKGKNYVGYVMIVPQASKVKLVDSRKKNSGTKLSQIVKEHNAIAGINAGGFTDVDGKGMGNQLCRATIIDKKLLYGNKSSKYSLIGLSADKKLVLGNYTYNQAINAGIESAVEFGPFLIVNGKKQITNSTSGGIHPRMAIGQRQDGTFIFVVVDGRQPGYSIGTNLLELQNIFVKYNAYNAANLDGGSSATMVYNGSVVNKTSTPIGERYLPNAFIVEK